VRAGRAGRDIGNDVLWAVLVGVLYLVVRLLLWPLWDRPLQHQDLIFALVIAGVTYVARQLPFRR
jgi:hypothetical protein